MLIDRLSGKLKRDESTMHRQQLPYLSLNKKSSMYSCDYSYESDAAPSRNLLTFVLTLKDVSCGVVELTLSCQYHGTREASTGGSSG